MVKLLLGQFATCEPGWYPYQWSLFAIWGLDPQGLDPAPFTSQKVSKVRVYLWHHQEVVVKQALVLRNFGHERGISIKARMIVRDRLPFETMPGEKYQVVPVSWNWQLKLTRQLQAWLRRNTRPTMNLTSAKQPFKIAWKLVCSETHTLCSSYASKPWHQRNGHQKDTWLEWNWKIDAPEKLQPNGCQCFFILALRAIQQVRLLLLHSGFKAGCYHCPKLWGVVLWFHQSIFHSSPPSSFCILHDKATIKSKRLGAKQSW